VNRIITDPNILDGEPCIRGTRISVHQITGMLANGDTVDGLLEDYPNLTRDDIIAAIEYAAKA
jgi:uncharacterized protein (DUF433 family)